MTCGIPQGSILGPLLFNSFVNNMFSFASKSDICDFADDNTLSSCRKTLGGILHNLKFDWRNIFRNRFKVNSLKPNPGKFQFVILGTNIGIGINLFLFGNRIEKSQKVVLHRITIYDT